MRLPLPPGTIVPTLMWTAVICVVVLVVGPHVSVHADPVVVPLGILTGVLTTVLLARHEQAGAGSAVRMPEPAAGLPKDRALTRTAWLVRSAHEGATWSERLHPRLVAAVDGRLHDRYGIDRTTEPDRARAVLGDELWRVVTDPGRPPRNPQALAAVIERIQAS